MRLPGACQQVQIDAAEAAEAANRRQVDGENLRPRDPRRSLLACGISCMAVWERLLQSVSLMKDMPTFSLLPTKLKPSGWKMPAMSLPSGLLSSLART